MDDGGIPYARFSFVVAIYDEEAFRRIGVDETSR